MTATHPAPSDAAPPLGGGEPFMPVVTLPPDTLIIVAGGEEITWAECQRRMAASHPQSGEPNAPAEVGTWKADVIAEHLAHLRRKGDDASCMVIEYQAATLAALSCKVEVMREALERIASPNQPPRVGFDYARQIARQALSDTNPTPDQGEKK
jgi:hypothetical protein